MREKIKRLVMHSAWALFRPLPVNRRKALFDSYMGKGYSDNPKYIADALLRKKPGVKLYWVTDGINPPCVPEKVKTVKINTVSYVYHMSTAGVWVDNVRKYRCLKKKNQFYVQTWHGGIGLKNIEKDCEDALEPSYVLRAKEDGAHTDVMLSNSKTLSGLYHKSFWFDGEIIEKGLPRNDRLVNFTRQDADRIRKKAGLPEDKRLCLYAPTFRKDGNTDVYSVDFDMMTTALSRRFGGDWLIIMRLHPNISFLAGSIDYGGRAVNVSDYPDIQELYMISDAIVTDYSSVMFDYMLLDRPCFLYAADVEEYKKDRDFFVPLSSLPFPLSENNAELAKNIDSFDEKAYRKKVEEFMLLHGYNETGSAAEAAADRIIEYIDNNKRRYRK